MVGSVVKLTRASKVLSQGAVALALLATTPPCHAQIMSLLGSLFASDTNTITRPHRPDTIDFPALRILDENGQPVPGAKVIVRRFKTQYYPELKWNTTDDEGITTPTLVPMGEPDYGKYIILAHAPGYAPKSVIVNLPTDDTVIDLPLTRGQQVVMKLTDSAGREIPDTLALSLFPETWSVNVWLKAQSEQVQNSDAGKSKTDVSSLPSEPFFSPYPVKRDSSSGSSATYTVQLDETSTEPLYLLVHHPGFLRAYQAGPFLAAEWITSKSIDLSLPEPASLAGILDLDGNKAESPVVTMLLHHTRKLPGQNLWSLRIHTEAMSPDKAMLAFDDLTPGEYSIEASMTTPDRVWAATVYSVRESATLASGSSETVTLKYAPFNEEWLKGPYTAKLKVLNLDGKPAAGASYKLTWDSRGYPTQTIAQGQVPDDGIVVIENLAGIDKPLTREEIVKLPAVPDYSFIVNGSRLGPISFFNYENGVNVPINERVYEEEFRLPPTVGDHAPDFAMHDIASSKTIHLSDLKGQVVLIDFWATWCGPCQEPMEKNQEILRKYKDEWKDKATILTVSIDDELETVIKHLDKNKWHESHNTWAPPNPDNPREIGWRSPAAKLYGINVIPTMILIDEDGVIKNRGPMDVEEAILSELGR